MEQTHTPATTPTFADLAADPAIAPLLTFTPVPRKVMRPDGWTPEAQRQFIALLAWFGIPSMAAKAIDKNLSGIAALYKLPHADSFRAAWDAAMEVGRARHAPPPVRAPLTRVPGILPRRRDDDDSATLDVNGNPRGEGQELNHLGEWEDKVSILRKVVEARDSMTRRLLQSRRLYLSEISDNPGKRAAFEMLTQLPIDWDRAARLEPQDDEPWKVPNMRTPEMLLTVENGWLGEIAHGPDKKRELRRMMDAERAAQGLDPIAWEEWDDSGH